MEKRPEGKKSETGSVKVKKDISYVVVNDTRGYTELVVACETLGGALVAAMAYLGVAVSTADITGPNCSIVGTGTGYCFRKYEDGKVTTTVHVYRHPTFPKQRD